MGKFAAFLLVLIGVFLFGCSSGPTDDDIADSVDSKLAGAMAETAEAQDVAAVAIAAYQLPGSSLFCPSGHRVV